MPAHVKDTDLGYKRIMEQLGIFHGASTKVGIIEGERYDGASTSIKFGGRKGNKRGRARGEGGATRLQWIDGKAHAAGNSGQRETDMVKIAIYNEFGTEKDGKQIIPARPAHAQAFAAHKETMNRAISRAYDDVLLGRRNARDAIAYVGLRFQTYLKKQIADFTTPENALSTQKAKGRKKHLPPGTLVDNPLEDTGQMRESVRHVEEFKR